MKEIEQMVAGGHSVMSADDNGTVSLVMAAIASGLTATFYVTPTQYRMVMGKYWTAERIADTGIKPIPDDEVTRIKKSHGLNVRGHSNTLECVCGHEYGAPEFFDQGVALHGIDQVKGVMEMKGACMIRVSPPLEAICPNCNRRFLLDHWYEHNETYGCCKP